MTWYQMLSLIGIPGICVALCTVLFKYLFNRLKDNDVQTKATKRGIQALLRAQMISEFNKAKDKGYAPIYAKDNFENMWKNYHDLGLNGVMDGIRERYMELPNRKEDRILNEHQVENQDKNIQ